MFFSRVRVSRNIQTLSRLHHVIRGNGYGAHQLLWDLFSGKERTFLFREEIAGEQVPHYKGAKGEPIYYIVSENEPSKENPLFEVASKPYNPRLAVGDRLTFKLRANPVDLTKKERTPSEIESWHAHRRACSFKEKEPTKKVIRHDVVMNVQYHLLRELAQAASVDDAGKKSELKQRILDALIVSRNPVVISKLERIIESNERYRELLATKPAPEKLFDFALKAAMNSALETWFSEKGKTNGFTIIGDEKRKRSVFQAESYRWHALPKKGKTAGFSSVDFEGEIEVTDHALFKSALCVGIGPAKGFGCGLMLVRRV